MPPQILQGAGDYA